MEVELNRLVGVGERSYWLNEVAAYLDATPEAVRKACAELGLPPHYRRQPVKGKPWCKKYIRVLYPTEILLIRVQIKPEFSTLITVPDWLWRERGRPAPSTFGTRWVQRRGVRKAGEAVGGEEAPVHEGDEENVCKL